MNTYRISKEAVKSSSLNSSVLLSSVACDRNAVLESVSISSRGGITANASHYSKFQVKLGSDVLCERSFETASLAALTSESLTVTAGDVSATSALALHYVHNGNGLAIDLDVTLVFRAARA